MGSLYRRKDSAYWWVAFIDAAGKQRCVSSKSEDEAVARKLLQAVERKVAAEKESGLAPSGPITVERYADKWLQERRERGIASADDDEGRLRHALPKLGQLELSAVRPRHVRDVMRALKKSGKLAPRTQLHVYGVLRVMFADAVTEELLEQSPCTLKTRRQELPEKRDKDPLWRATAVYSREEVVALISDKRVPEDRRILYAIVFLAGTRIGEAGALRWSRYEQEARPLGRLAVAKSFNEKMKAEKGTKKENPRLVPVHLILAKVLAVWRAEGWERVMGRPPTEEDLIIPAREGGYRRGRQVLKQLHQDCRELGLRPRRTHDARRTLISLARADGARKDILRWITHGPPKEIMEDYTTFPWEALCEEIAKLRIQLPVREESTVQATAEYYGNTTFPAGTKKPPSFRNLGALLEWRRRESNPPPGGGFSGRRKPGGSRRRQCTSTSYSAGMGGTV
ncbi:tyrosine-type recombinase/integrase [Hyalangium versicolor]|uniref:tyrosine-type recombinase/integrase n=1 Tax=Hyalangium versicolor TaxID=2861190 RepID=UPI001CCE5401|nr:hypothetical protein [Hyalangium versicolor]